MDTTCRHLSRDTLWSSSTTRPGWGDRPRIRAFDTLQPFNRNILTPESLRLMLTRAPIPNAPPAAGTPRDGNRQGRRMRSPTQPVAAAVVSEPGPPPGPAPA